jgi:predicted nucleic acid-binding protein
MRRSPDRIVVDWLVRNDQVLALSTVVIAEIAYGIQKIRTDERSPRLAAGLQLWRERCRHRIRPFD